MLKITNTNGDELFKIEDSGEIAIKGNLVDSKDVETKLEEVLKPKSEEEEINGNT